MMLITKSFFVHAVLLGGLALACLANAELIVQPITPTAIPAISVSPTTITEATTPVTTPITRPNTTSNNQIVVRNNHQTGLPPAQLGISPSVVNANLELAKGSIDKSLVLYNYNTQPKSIKLSLIDLDSNLKPTQSSSTTLKTWTLINPTQFTIPAGGYQTVRISFRPPSTFAKGDYHSVLLIEQQIDDSAHYDEADRVVRLEIGSRYGLPIKLTVR